MGEALLSSLDLVGVLYEEYDEEEEVRMESKNPNDVVESILKEWEQADKPKEEEEVGCSGVWHGPGIGVWHDEHDEKAQLFEISKEVIQLKSEIEKIREQKEPYGKSPGIGGWYIPEDVKQNLWKEYAKRVPL